LKIVIIAAVAKNRVIGRSNGDMPWHNKDEFKHFKNTTLGFPVIMGRKTFETQGFPLKERLNIVLTRQNNYYPDFENVKVMDSLHKAYDFCRKNNYQRIFVIGGGYIFPEAMKDADEMIISIMDMNAEGDVYFPEIKEEEWNIASRDKRNGFEILYYERRKR
jgi:dihydrofolate reductase